MSQKSNRKISPLTFSFAWKEKLVLVNLQPIIKLCTCTVSKEALTTQELPLDLEGRLRELLNSVTLDRLESLFLWTRQVQTISRLSSQITQS